MPTMEEAARLLKVSGKTLRKWIAILNERNGPELQIVPSVHPYDGRFWTITADEVQRIATARAQMPHAAAYIPQAPPRRAVVREVPPEQEPGAAVSLVPLFTRPPNPSLPIQPVGGLFPTRMHASRWLEAHGVNQSTARHWHGWSQIALDPRAVLLFAMQQRRSGDLYRHRWQLHQCQDEDCACRELLLH